MQDIFNINKHIEKWDDYENLYKLIGDGNLTDEAIEWYKFRTAMAILSNCVSSWNKNHFRSCKSASELEMCFQGRGNIDIKRDLYGRLSITMPKITYIIFENLFGPYFLPKSFRKRSKMISRASSEG